MAKTRKKRRRKKSQRIPLAATMGALSPFITPCPSGRTIVGDAMKGDFEALMYDAREKLAGIDNMGNLNFHWIVQTYTPVIVGGLVSKFVGKFVNKYFDKIPLVGKYIGA